MHGRIKSGEGTLIGNAGEQFVVAELLKQGIIAAMTPRNAPSFDILATNGEKTIKIRVKTKSEPYNPFMWNVKKDGSIFHHLTTKNDFVVMVNLKEGNERPDYFIVPTFIVNRWLNDQFKKWVISPGKNGRPHNPKNKQRHLSFKTFETKLNKLFKDKWELLFK